MSEQRGQEAPPLTLFYCYAREDQALLDELEKHLDALKRQGLISGWSDREILAGQERQWEVDAHLNTADIVLLLLSPDFIASDYCYSSTMLQAWERHKAGKTHIIPILLRPVAWEEMPIRGLQALPRNGEPVALWPNRDQAFLDIARGIREISRRLVAQKTGVLPQSVFDASIPPFKVPPMLNQQAFHSPYAIINTHEAVHIFHGFMQPDSPMRVLRLVGKGKMGKSHLLTKVFPILARQHYQAQCVFLDLRNPVYTPADTLQIACSQLGSQFCDRYAAACAAWGNASGAPTTNPKGSAERRFYLTWQFVQEAGKWNGTLLLLFDSVDGAPKSMQAWLMDLLLVQLASLAHVRVVLAGRSLPEPHASSVICCGTYQLHPITDEQAYIDYCQCLNARLVEQSVRDIAYVCDYIPGVFADLVQSKFLPQEETDG